MFVFFSNRIGLVGSVLISEEINVFCEEMYKQLEFKSHNERLPDILHVPRLGSLRTCPARPTETYSAKSAQGCRETSHVHSSRFDA